MKSLTKGKMWCYAIGQLGWSIISGLIGSWLVYFYQPDAAAKADGMVSLIPDHSTDHAVPEGVTDIYTPETACFQGRTGSLSLAMARSCVKIAHVFTDR